MKALVLSSSLLCSLAVTAADFKQASLDMILQQVNNSADFSQGMQCLGVSVTKGRKLYEKVAKDCYAKQKHLEMEQFVNAIGVCIDSSFFPALGVKPVDVERCQSDEDKALQAVERNIKQIEQLEAQLDQLYMAGELSQAQQQKADKIEQQLQLLSDKQIALEDALPSSGMGPQFPGSGEEMQASLSLNRKYHESTLDQITLPLYKNSQVLMHMTQEQMQQAGEWGIGLPAATFFSKDPVTQIVAYYQKHLPAFKLKQIAKGQFLLMEELPKNFDMLTHMQLYLKTPHVLVKTALNDPTGMIPADAKAIIEISYRR